MGRQRFPPEQIIAKLREVDVIVGRGGTTDEACLSNGVQKGPPIGVEEGPPFQII